MRILATGAAVAATVLIGAPAALANTLVITDHGAPIAVGEEAHHRLELIPINVQAAGCKRRERGLVATNGKGSDKLTFGSTFEQSCSPGGSLSGATKEVKLSAKGAYSAKFSPKLVFGEPGPCVYTISKMAGTFKPGEAAATFVFGTGKLDKKASSPSCAAKEAFEAISELSDETDEELFTELRG
jgi:hypothetical protein